MLFHRLRLSVVTVLLPTLEQQMNDEQNDAAAHRSTPNDRATALPAPTAKRPPLPTATSAGPSSNRI